MKWFVLYQIISGDFERVGAGRVSAGRRLSSGASARNRRTQKTRKPIGCERFTPGLKPRPPKETARAQAGVPVPRRPKQEQEQPKRGGPLGTDSGQGGPRPKMIWRWGGGWMRVGGGWGLGSSEGVPFAGVRI